MVVALFSPQPVDVSTAFPDGAAPSGKVTIATPGRNTYTAFEDGINNDCGTFALFSALTLVTNVIFRARKTGNGSGTIGGSLDSGSRCSITVPFRERVRLVCQPRGGIALRSLERWSRDHAHVHAAGGRQLDRKDLDRVPYDDAALRRPGIFVEFDYAIEGYKGQALPLRWQLIDARGGDQLGKSRDTQLVPEASTDKASWDVWVPLPRRHVERVFVQLQLFEQRGTVPIGRLRTPAFAVSSQAAN